MKNTTEELKDLNKIYENMMTESGDNPYINYKEQLENAFDKFEISFDELNDLFAEGRENAIIGDFEDDYPFGREDFEVINSMVRDWVYTSKNIVRDIDPYMFDNEDENE